MKLIIGNWKLNPDTLKKAQKLISDIEQVKPVHKAVLCPPAIYLPLLKSKFDLGGQDLFWQDSGAHTGQISAGMLKQFKAKWVIIGHSERRTLGETDHEINLKVQKALAAKLTPVLCIGYGLTPEMDEEEVLMKLQEQLSIDLKDVDAAKVVVAYEPVWAISAGDPSKPKKTPTPEHAERIAMFVRIKFKVKKVLYGGSVNANNAADFLKHQIDGLLVGGASLVAKEFKQILTTKV